MASPDFIGGSELANSRGRFTSPWVDMASQYAPRTMIDVLRLAEHLSANSSTWSEASNRIVAYFLTKIKLTGQSTPEQEKFKAVLEKQFGVVERLREIGDDFMVYDNSFISMVPSFIRYAKCLNCKNQSKETAVVLKNQPFKFRIGDMSCHLRCQRCGRTSRHSIHDGAGRPAPRECDPPGSARPCQSS